MDVVKLQPGHIYARKRHVDIVREASCPMQCDLLVCVQVDACGAGTFYPVRRSHFGYVFDNYVVAGCTMQSNEALWYYEDIGSTVVL